MNGHYSPDQLKKAAMLLELLEPGQKATGYKHDLSPAAGVAPYSHGNAGLFNTPGVDANVFSTIMLPMMGVLDALPLMPAGSASPDGNFGGVESPLYSTVTGVTKGAAETWANMPAAVCDPAPEGGLLKVCTMTAPYGRIPQCLRPIELGQVGRLATAADPTNLRLVNQPFQQGGNAIIPQFAAPGSLFNIEMAKRMFEGFTSYKRLIAPIVYTGSPALNTASDGAMQWIGLETLVNAGNKVDYLGTLCPSMDSDIKQFGFDLVNGTGRSIVNYIDTMYGYLKYNSLRYGLDPTTWKIAMRPELFDEIVKVWPVEQHLWALDRIANFTNGRVMIDASTATQARDDMLRGRWLPIRGDRVEIIVDDSIPEDNVTTNGALAAGQYASDIYFLPFTVLGGIPVFWWETFNFNNGNIQAVLAAMGSKEAVWTTDGGRFLFWTKRTETCITMCWRMEPRIILRTPYLAGRIQDVAYQPLQHYRSAFPDDAYFTNGGRTNTPIATYYNEFSTTTPVVQP